MHNSASNISFNIDAWQAHSQGLFETQHWQEWAKNLHWPQEAKIVTSAIPAMMRRRMSTLSKLAVQTSIELLEQHEVDYLVFASRHGELHRSVKLVNDILSGEEASPMAFSQSVHNTAAGLATIATKKPIPLTSIAGSENTFQSAILEAWLYLNAHPQHKVLVIDFDETLPTAYQKFEDQDYNGYSLGLVLSSGEDYALQQKPQISAAKQPTLPQGLEFIRHFLSNQTQWNIESPQKIWTWQRN